MLNASLRHARCHHNDGKCQFHRHQTTYRILKDSIYGVSRPAIRQLARRGGVKRMSGFKYKETRGVLRAYLRNIIQDAITYTVHARRNTMTVADVVYALEHQGQTVYGFGI